MAANKIYTALGDDGYTGLLGPGRVPKYHPQPEAFGTLDEVSAAMGLARALAQSERTKSVLLESQRHLYTMMGELASTPETVGKFPGITPDDVSWLEQQVDAYSAEITLPREFVLPGDSAPGAALDVARTVTRRAERLVVRLIHAAQESSDQVATNVEIMRYLNRLSSLLFVLARYEDTLSGVGRVTMAREDS